MTRTAAGIVVGLVAVTAACASARATRRDDLRRELDAVRYERSIDEVWHEVRRLLFERRYPLSGNDAEEVGQPSSFLSRLFTPAKETRDDGRGGRFLETGWKNGVRYRVDGTVDGSGCRVVFTAIQEDLTEHGRDAGRSRDLELELELARRLAPEEATRIERGLAHPTR